MSFEDNTLISQLQAAQAKIETMKQAYEPAIEKIQAFKTAFGVKERSDGAIEIDYDKFVQNLGVEAALELRLVIDETYQISGGPGKKPRVKVAAA